MIRQHRRESLNTKITKCFLATLVLAAVIGATPTACCAQTSEPSSHENPFIQRFDQDGDGLVSAGEFPADENLFNLLDVDGDGYLNGAEAPKPPPPHGRPDINETLAAFDVDRDGQLSQAEFPGPEELFDEADSDEDGFLSVLELLVGGPRPSIEDCLARDDSDGDGLVSREEFKGPAEIFDLLDADGDSYITREKAQSGPPCNRVTKDRQSLSQARGDVQCLQLSLKCTQPFSFVNRNAGPLTKRSTT